MNTQQDKTTKVSAPETRIDNWAKQNGITAKFEFIPFSKSRNKSEKLHSLNYKVMLAKNERDFMSFDYSQGQGHAPSYKQNIRYAVEQEKVNFECETGRIGRDVAGSLRAVGTVPHPKLSDILYSIQSDSDAINYASFEDWAIGFGYDKDSRKAEAIYKTCIEYGLKLRAAVGNKAIQELQRACLDY